MSKRFGIVGAVLAATLALSALAAPGASANGRLACYEVSDFTVIGNNALDTKGGQYSNKKCEAPPVEILLDGRYILATPLIKTVEDLWCAEIDLTLPGGYSGEDGYYKDEHCTEKNATANASDYTEVIVPLTEFSKELEGEIDQKVTSTFKNPGKGLLEGEIISTELTGETTPTNKKEGTFHLDFKNSECKAVLGKGKAKSKGDESGIILVLGKYKIVGWLDISAYAVLELEPVMIECVAMKIEVSGTVIGGLAPIGEKAKEFKFTLKEKESKQELPEYETDKGEKVKAELRVTVDGDSGPAWQNESEPIVIKNKGGEEDELT